MRKEYNFGILDEVKVDLLTEREEKVLELIKANPNLTANEIKELLTISVATVNNTLRSLKQKDYIKHSDSEEKDKWIILKIC